MVIKWDVTIPRLSGDTPRRAYIYLPESYDEEPDRRYPVMYMFDGHNVFFDEDATFGKSWGMNDYMERTGKQLIIVGVECNHQGNCRLSEYSPVTFENAELGKIRGRGSTTMNWMVNELKPYIDEHFRTLPDRRNTILCGFLHGRPDGAVRRDGLQFRFPAGGLPVSQPLGRAGKGDGADRQGAYPSGHDHLHGLRGK